jgi:hypothetical protein
MHLTYNIRYLNEAGGERHSHSLNCNALKDAVAVAIAEKVKCARIEISQGDRVVWRRDPRSFLEVGDGKVQAYSDDGRLELS